MADRTQIREFLTTRRARITPEQAGLPVYGGSRRVAGLRREEVALLAGVRVDYYNKLERGNLDGVSESVLDALARALQLTEAERDHLYDLARSANTRGVPASRRHRPSVRRVRPGLQLVLDSITEAHRARTDLGQEFGATEVVSERGLGAAERVRELTRGDGTGTVLDCVGTMEVLQTAFGAVGDGGVISRAGVPQYAEGPIGMDMLMRNITLTGGVTPARLYGRATA
jgi:transcriptional regulator with XRE-family HTH domain